MKLTAKQRNEGAMLPPFWYGLTYTDPCYRYQIYHPIPLNLLIRAGMLFKHGWDRLRSQPTWMDKQIALSLEPIRERERRYYDLRLEQEIDIVKEQFVRRAQ